MFESITHTRLQAAWARTDELQTLLNLAMDSDAPYELTEELRHQLSRARTAENELAASLPKGL